MPHTPSRILPLSGLLSLGLLALSGSTHAQVSLNVYRVGADSACDYRTDDLPNALQAAIDDIPTSPPAGIQFRIELANNGSYDNLKLQLLGRSVEIAGGFANCAATAPSATATTLRANPAVNAPVLLIDGQDQPDKHVVLRHLILSDASGTEARGLTVEDAHVDLFGVTVRDNQGATFGGGIRVLGTTARLGLYENSFVIENRSSQDGGGIHCSRGATLFLDTASAVRSNEAAFNGGGIAIVGCTAYVNSGGHGLQATGYNVGFNTALQGGGISLSSLYATAPTRLILGKDVPASTARPQIMGNMATGLGGGILAMGEGTQVEAYDTVFSSNQSGQQGGGLSVRNGATATIKRTHRQCAPAPHCSSFVDNTAVGGGAVGVGYDGSKAFIEGTWFKGNKATSNGAVYQALNGHSEIISQNNVLVKNEGPNIISISPTAESPNAASITLKQDTIARNTSGASTIATHSTGLLKMGRTLVSPGAGIAVVSGSPIGPAPQMHCNVLEGTLGVEHADSLTTTDTVINFVNAAADDFRPTSSSEAVDHCPAQAGYLAYDHNLVPRPVDSALPDIHGPFDAGAYEWNQMLFWDGFEE